MAPLSMLCVLAAVACANPQDAPDGAPGPLYAFSPGPLERAWALVDPATRAARFGEVELPESSAPNWCDEGPWSEWARRVEACRSEDTSAETARDRLWLAAFARRQGRDDDAWEHLAHAHLAPGELLAVLPMFVPGVDPAATPHGEDASYPDGVLLAPALPPPRGAARDVVLGTGRPRPGFARVEGLRVGAATLTMSVTVESDGVQIDLVHTGGGPATVRVLLPEAPDFELRSEYVDWMRQEGPRAPREVTLAAGDDKHELFGRFRHRKVEWPTELPLERTLRMTDPGILMPYDEGTCPNGVGVGLAALLGVRVQMAGLDPESFEPWSGIVIDLTDPELYERKLAGVVSLAERFALSRRP